MGPRPFAPVRNNRTGLAVTSGDPGACAPRPGLAIELGFTRFSVELFPAELEYKV